MDLVERRSVNVRLGPARGAQRGPVDESADLSQCAMPVRVRIVMTVIVVVGVAVLVTLLVALLVAVRLHMGVAVCMRVRVVHMGVRRLGFLALDAELRSADARA